MTESSLERMQAIAAHAKAEKEGKAREAAERGKAEAEAKGAERAEVESLFASASNDLSGLEAQLATAEQLATETTDLSADVQATFNAELQTLRDETVALRERVVSLNERKIKLDAELGSTSPAEAVTAEPAIEDKPKTIDAKQVQADFDTLFRDARTRISELKYGFDPYYDDTKQVIKANDEARNKFAEDLIAAPDKIPTVLEAMRQRAETPFLDVAKVTGLRDSVTQSNNDDKRFYPRDERTHLESELDTEQTKQFGKLQEKKKDIESCLLLLKKLVQSGGEKVKIAELQQTARAMMESYAKMAEDFDVMAPEQGGDATWVAANLFLDHPQLYQDTESAKGLLTRQEQRLKTTTDLFGIYDEKLKSFSGVHIPGHKLGKEGATVSRDRTQANIRYTRKRITDIGARVQRGKMKLSP